MTVIRMLIFMALIAIGTLPTNYSVSKHLVDQLGCAAKYADVMENNSLLFGIETILNTENYTMTKNFYNTPESFLISIGAIEEGKRNKTLYKTGVYLRSNFGLQGNELLECLLGLNTAKCDPPLEDDEVATIAASVDRAKTSVGSRVCSVDVYLEKQISMFTSATTNTPGGTVTVGQFIDACKSGKFREQIEVIRAEPDKEQRNNLKKGLPAVTIQSEACEQRSRELCKSNGIICLDFDNLGDMDIEKAKQTIASVHYVIAVSASASGQGVFAIAALPEPVDDLKKVLAAMQKDFEFEIDKSGSDVSRLRFVTHDPDLILKDIVIPYFGKRKVALEKTGIDILDSLLEQHIEVVSFIEREGQIPTHKTYYVKSIVNLLKTAQEQGLDFGMKNGSPHVFNGKFWQRIDADQIRLFLQITGTVQGIPHDVIRDYQFVDKLQKQFASEARFPVLPANDTPKINLRNGTLHFLPTGPELKPFDKRNGLTYQLAYDFDPSAEAPLFKKYFDRVQPDTAVQRLLFQYVAYVLLPRMKLEKMLFLCGVGDNGKSVFLDIVMAIFGKDQCCAFPLDKITKSDYVSAELGNYLLNVCREISPHMKSDTFKTIVSREPLHARHPYGRPFTMYEYATSIFAINKALEITEHTHAMFRRFMLVDFSVTITEAEKDRELAQKIIGSEISGVLNLIIDGVKSLLATGKFDEPESVRKTVEDFRKESDTAATYMEECGFSPGTDDWIPLRDMHFNYKMEYTDGVSKREFAVRLRSLGYKVDRAGRDNTISVYVARKEAVELG